MTMMTTSTAIIFLSSLLLLSLQLTAARKEIGKTEVDDLRLKFLNLEEQLWDYVLDVTDNGIKEQTTKPEVHLIRQFQSFADEINEV